MRTDTSGALTTLTRLGFASRGLLYLVIGFLILRTGRTEDTSGALSVLAEGGGRILLALMIAGFGLAGATLRRQQPEITQPTIATADFVIDLAAKRIHRGDHDVRRRAVGRLDRQQPPQPLLAAQ